MDLNDKKAWCAYGELLEKEFVARIAPNYGLNAIINPQKETNPYVYDLVVNGSKADLKYEGSFLRKAQEFLGIEPFYCVQLNEKDYLRYKRLYPDLKIYFWLRRPAAQIWDNGKSKTIPAQHGVYMADFSKLAKYIETKPLLATDRFYAKRRDDVKGNNKRGFYFDLSNSELFTELHYAKSGRL